MSKLKTKKGAVKRFKFSKKGKIKYHPGGKSHLLTSKESERTRKLKRTHKVKNKKWAKYLKRMLPYGTV